MKISMKFIDNKKGQTVKSEMNFPRKFFTMSFL